MDLSQIYLAVSIFKILLVALVLILNHQKRKLINKLTLDSSLAVSKVRQETKLRKTRWLILPNIHVVTFINFFEKILPLLPFLGLITVLKNACMFITVEKSIENFIF